MKSSKEEIFEDIDLVDSIGNCVDYGYASGLKSIKGGMAPLLPRQKAMLEKMKALNKEKNRRLGIFARPCPSTRYSK